MVMVLAVMWLVFEIVILTIPSEFHDAALASASVIGVGIIVFASISKTRTRRLLP